jgi:hypothetical protein
MRTLLVRQVLKTKYILCVRHRQDGLACSVLFEFDIDALGLHAVSKWALKT